MFRRMSRHSIILIVFFGFVCCAESSSPPSCPFTSSRPSPYSILSPININSKKVIPIETSSPLYLQNGLLGSLEVVNNGNSLEVFTQPHTSKTFAFYGGVFCNQFYRIYKFRVYINPNLKGSTTHLIDGKGLVGFNSKYESFRKAQDHNDGVAIMNIQFAFTTAPSPFFAFLQAPIIRAVRKPGSSVKVAPAALAFAWTNIVPLIDRYYAFNGSYTQLGSGKHLPATVIVPIGPFPVISVAQFKNTYLKLMSENGSQLVTVEDVFPTAGRPVYEAKGVNIRVYPI